MRSTLVALLVAVALTGCAVERHEVTYDDYFDAKAQDAIKREWVPEWLPEQTTRIREVHQGQTGNALLRATWPSDAELPADCTIVEDAPPPPLQASWFPEDVPTRGGIHQCDDDSYVVLADGVLYRWTVPPSDDPSPTSLPRGA